MKKVILYTDGACSGNPGPGGYGAILIYNNIEKEISGGEKDTTNNKMEMMAVIKGLEMLKEPCEVEVYSDSAYVVNSIEKGWIYSWKKNGWKKADKKEVKNIDLWERLLKLMETHKVTFLKVKGHADNELNNRCDRLAVSEREKFA
ncbi:MAG: ribonuclease HI [Clostridia bacterium]|nr:ribonuclease HI [Clostridia bacterium]